ncbi:hypothetical protein [Halocatena pleomorpha]|uniref:Uncharacterized protein n=1 Tax=Halocatena pleomorpha TaxID=1785090 RepID=A0A3P3RLP2_9EURY|nr:hypothetical protein [Halocatena pleomorpha]RRJ34224.1 hypothetical protein EIK79_00125 [Halocatena pleomorpha]
MITQTLSTVRARAKGFWDYYLIYARTRVGVHAAATAGLTAFGLLMYFNRWFVIPAIAVYLFPPVYLYLAGDLPEHPQTNQQADDGDTDSDSDGTDADADADGADADADSDGADADADSDGADADADSDGADADADSDG